MIIIPKIISKEERALTKEAIYNVTIQLIKEKGVRYVTVEDITTAVGIAKGSFYSYYQSKEACLYDVIIRAERKAFERTKEIMSFVRTDRGKVIALLQELFTSQDSLFFYIGQKDVDMLLRKLPVEYHEKGRQKDDSNFQTAIQLMNLDEHQMEVVALFTSCLSLTASNRTYSRPAINEALNLMIYALADYLAGSKRKG